MWAMEQILFMSFDKRLAIFLLDETAKTNSTDLHVTQEQLRNTLTAQGKLYSKCLKSFKLTVFNTIQRMIHIINKDKLRNLIE